MAPLGSASILFHLSSVTPGDYLLLKLSQQYPLRVVHSVSPSRAVFIPFTVVCDGVLCCINVHMGLAVYARYPISGSLSYTSPSVIQQVTNPLIVCLRFSPPRLLIRLQGCPPSSLLSGDPTASAVLPVNCQSSRNPRLESSHHLNLLKTIILSCFKERQPIRTTNQQAQLRNLSPLRRHIRHGEVSPCLHLFADDLAWQDNLFISSDIFTMSICHMSSRATSPQIECGA
ncbi:hypothetical protein Hypma_010683 [Hypsizygus marmoreus]|uniref:Uncharacterized protein n=1 Tax=Hypsizygus marmoreus TaxID=39966 RepID=A0A369JLU1_HYPMA|nr:hypothetical protein Hypma_010683 [Hypsizygus marmoreus]